MDVTITTGLVSTNTTPMLKLVASNKLPAEKFATHTFKLIEIIDAYDTFGRAAETKALKVVMQA
jgi:alcohol dehydrogenase